MLIETTVCKKETGSSVLTLSSTWRLLPRWIRVCTTSTWPLPAARSKADRPFYHSEQETSCTRTSIPAYNMQTSSQKYAIQCHSSASFFSFKYYLISILQVEPALAKVPHFRHISSCSRLEELEPLIDIDMQSGSLGLAVIFLGIFIVKTFRSVPWVIHGDTIHLLIPFLQEVDHLRVTIFLRTVKSCTTTLHTCIKVTI